MSLNDSCELLLEKKENAAGFVGSILSESVTISDVSSPDENIFMVNCDIGKLDFSVGIFPSDYDIKLFISQRATVIEATMKKMAGMIAGKTIKKKEKPLPPWEYRFEIGGAVCGCSKPYEFGKFLIVVICATMANEKVIHEQLQSINDNLITCNPSDPLPSMRQKDKIEKEKTADGGGCFIATEVYGSYSATEVIVFRAFRDEVLNKYLIGKVFIKTYYSISPKIAFIISKSNRFKKCVKALLDKVYVALQKNNYK